MTRISSGFVIGTSLDEGFLVTAFCLGGGGGSGADTDIPKGGARNNNRAAKFCRPRPQNGRDRVQTAAKRPVFDIFGVFL